MNIHKTILYIFTIILSTFNFSFATNYHESINEISFDNGWFNDSSLISGLKLPRSDTKNFEWDEPIILIKWLLNKIIEYSPIIIFVMLLFGCFQMIVSVKSWPWETWKKIIKQVIFWAILLVLCIFWINIASIYLSGTPLINFPK